MRPAIFSLLVILAAAAVGALATSCISGFDPESVDLAKQEPEDRDAGDDVSVPDTAAEDTAPDTRVDDVGGDDTSDVLDEPDVAPDVDCSAGPVFYPDLDGDGHGDATGEPSGTCPPEPGWVPSNDDCDDDNVAVYPGAIELVGDHLDSDCDGIEICNVDRDQDGYHQGVTVESSNIACDGPEQGDSAVQGGDCDEADALVYPGAPELCDDKDNDCDGQADEEVTVVTWYLDRDSDGYGRDDTTVESCEVVPGHALRSGDCDDSTPAISPGADEVCDGFDNDCDDNVDNDALDAQTFYADTDGDGYGDPQAPLRACQWPGGHVDNDLDCDDSNDATSPDEPEVCDDADNDCDGTPDNGCDDDGDGYCDIEMQILDGTVIPSVCPQGPGDCDDTTAATHPMADEVCDGEDNDCNGAVDDGEPVDAPTYYEDADRDGYGDPNSPVVSCQPPVGLPSADQAGDCNDDEPSVHPLAVEQCNYFDDDCDGQYNEDDVCPAEICSLNQDMDRDGLSGCADPDCATSTTCQSAVVILQDTGSEARVLVLDMPGGNFQESRSFCCQPKSYSLAIDPDGENMWLSMGEGGLQRLRIATLAGRGTVGLQFAGDMVLDARRRDLVVAGQSDVLIVDTEQRFVEEHIILGDSISKVAGLSMSEAREEVAVLAEDTAGQTSLYMLSLASRIVTDTLPIDGSPWDVVHLGDKVVTWDDTNDTFTVVTRDPLAVDSAASVNLPTAEVVAFNRVNNLRAYSTGTELFAMHTPSQAHYVRFEPANGALSVETALGQVQCLLPRLADDGLVMAHPQSGTLDAFSVLQQGSNLPTYLPWESQALDSGSPIVDMIWAGYK